MGNWFDAMDYQYPDKSCRRINNDLGKIILKYE